MNTVTMLRNNIINVLEKQGYSMQENGLFTLRENDREAWREAHQIAKVERLLSREKFIIQNIRLVQKYFVDGNSLDISKITPELREVKSETEDERLFKWWNMAWWSLPYERGYGRQMRFIVWDKYHNAPIGLIGLQSPILSWGVRDTFLGIPAEDRDFWVNQSLSAQRIGALPPYNDILAGKLVTTLMTSDTVRKRFEKKYKGKQTLLKERVLPSRLLFITTTGAYGKSSVYQRLKFNDEVVAKFIGFSNGSGTFHIPNSLYEELVSYLKNRGYNVGRGYGNGPSRKLRIIDNALQKLGFANGAMHGIKRAVYFFPMVENLDEVIHKKAAPKWTHRHEDEITEFWKNRWAYPRAERNKTYLTYKSQDFLNSILYNLEQYKQVSTSL